MEGVYIHVASRLFAALPLEPIADAIESAGMGWQCEWENPTGWRFNGAGFFQLADKIDSIYGVRAHDFDQGRFGGPTH